MSAPSTFEQHHLTGRRRDSSECWDGRKSSAVCIHLHCLIDGRGDSNGIVSAEKNYFKSKFPELCYHKFVASCVLRICVGYLFLVNVLFILMRAREVLDIFFDFIALQFLQQLDDIAFNLARMGVFSKSLRAETTNKYFRTEFKKEVDKAEKSRRISLFLKAIYFMNLIGLLCGQIYVSRKQSRGDYQCKSITVIIKDEVWEDSVVQVPGKDIEKMVLIYPYFNGHYNQDGSSHDGRPVYVEQNKFDGTEFSTKVPAQIKYCKSIRAWVFTHEYIRKRKSNSTRDDSDCPWLLRSEETDVFDIEEVQGPWQIWAGVIGRTDGAVCILSLFFGYPDVSPLFSYNIRCSAIFSRYSL